MWPFLGWFSGFRVCFDLTFVLLEWVFDVFNWLVMIVSLDVLLVISLLGGCCWIWICYLIWVRFVCYYCGCLVVLLIVVFVDDWLFACCLGVSGGFIVLTLIVDLEFVFTSFWFLVLFGVCSVLITCCVMLFIRLV